MHVARRADLEPVPGRVASGLVDVLLCWRPWGSCMIVTPTASLPVHPLPSPVCRKASLTHAHAEIERAGGQARLEPAVLALRATPGEERLNASQQD